MKSILAGVIASFIAISTASAQSQDQTQFLKPKIGQPTAQLLNATRNMTILSRITICAGQSIPEGYIVIGTERVPSCGGSGFDANAYVIKQVASPDRMCWFSPRPSGFVITGRPSVFTCLNYPGNIGTYQNAYDIKIPGLQETVCSFSPFPSGYVTTSYTTVFDCGGGLDNAIMIKVPGTFETVCHFSSIPSGYYITGTGYKWGCGATVGSGFNTYNIRRL